jgi:hypothetical protein
LLPCLNLKSSAAPGATIETTAEVAAAMAAIVVMHAVTRLRR